MVQEFCWEVWARHHGRHPEGKASALALAAEKNRLLFPVHRYSSDTVWSSRGGYERMGSSTCEYRKTTKYRQI